MEMSSDLGTELRELLHALDEIDRDARRVLHGLSPEAAIWRPHAGSWSVAQCLDHLAITNRVYLKAMSASADAAEQRGSRRTKRARPGWPGRFFIRMLEPPVHPLLKVATTAVAQPRDFPSGADALADFLASQQEVRHFVAHYAGIELASVRFVNPFIRGVRFSLATGLHVIAAHDRRHLWQAWQVRRLLEETVPV